MTLALIRIALEASRLHERGVDTRALWVAIRALNATLPRPACGGK